MTTETEYLQTPLAKNSAADSGVDRASNGRSLLQSFDAGREAAANSFRRAASFLRDTEAIRTSTTTQRVAETVSGKLDVAAEYLDTHDCERLIAQGRTAVTSNPGRSLAVAAVLGLVVGASLRRNA